MLKKHWMDFFKNAGIILAVVLAVIQLWNWITAPSVSLYANVEYATLKYPPTLQHEFERINQQLDEDNLEKLVDIDSVPGANEDKQIKPTLKRVLSELSWKIKEGVPSYIPDDIARLEGIYWITITNDSSTALNKVQLTVPHAVLAEIRRAGQNITTTEMTDVIELRTMQPTDKISLVVWTNYSISKYDADDIRLTHELGIGTITVRALASPFGQWIDRNWPFLIFMAPMILLWTAVIAIPVFLSLRRRTESNSTEELPTEEAESVTDKDAEQNK